MLYVQLQEDPTCGHMSVFLHQRIYVSKQYVTNKPKSTTDHPQQTKSSFIHISSRSRYVNYLVQYLQTYETNSQTNSQTNSLQTPDITLPREVKNTTKGTLQSFLHDFNSHFHKRPVG